ncbi:hypothetical protein ACFQY0_20880 [Haloferula chungangensis]|uniref:Uncharacterized protein n=1 Tax=Haloferula chungangensis TaxID=1048331 RepID=A0ABW2LB25_9BACT
MEKPTQYSIEIRRLDSIYQPGDELPNDCSLIAFSTSTPMGAISVGDSITDGPGLSFLGVVGHINHMIGEFGSDSYMHLIRVYLNPIDEDSD